MTKRMECFILWSNITEDNLNLGIVLKQLQMSSSGSRYVKARIWKNFYLPEKSEAREKTKKCALFYGGAW